MVGSDDARRIAKAARLSPSFRAELLEGLRQRAQELRRDLGGLEQTTRLLRARFEGERAEDLERLDRSLSAWRAFCEFLDVEFEPEPEHLMRCLLFSGIRATALRAMEAFPGGANVLPSLAGAGASFQAGRRGIKADRCLFHVGACIVPTAKPHKCADFFCGSDPGLINDVVDRLGFDEFTLAHFTPRAPGDVLPLLEAELAMGAEFFESKVIAGGDGDLSDQVAARLRDEFSPVREVTLEGSHLDTEVDVPRFTSGQAGEALVLHCGSVDALGVYELAVALVRARGESLRPAVVVLADEWRACAGAEHPLWRERAMSQPLSALELIAIVED